MAEKKVYTEKEKAEALKLEKKIGNRAAAEQLGISWQLLARWKRDAAKTAATSAVKAEVKKARGKAKAAAEEVKAEAKKAEATVKAEAKKTRGKAKAAAAELKEVAQDVALDAAIKVEDKALIERIEAKKKVRATGRKAKDAAGDVKEKAKAATKSKPKAFKASYILQSAFGHELIVDEIQAKIPDDVEKVYIRIDQNKLHFIRKDGSTGSVDIW